MSDVFISYSRRDIDFVRHLFDQLTVRDREPWADWQDIPPTADWLSEIYSGIEAADSFLFIISPDSVSSEICTLEIEHAVKHNKRLIPVVWKEVEGSQVHSSMTAHNWVFLRAEDDFDTSFGLLIDALDTDLEYVREHTRLLRSAIEWEANERRTSASLRGQELIVAEGWLAQSGSKDPQPADLHREYLVFSRMVVTRLQRLIATSIAVVFVCLLGLLVFASLQRQKAMGQKLVAEKQRLRAEKAARISSSQSLATSAFLEMGKDPELSILLASQSIRTTYQEDKTVLPLSNSALRRSIIESRIRLTLKGHDDRVFSAAYSPDGQWIATGSWDKTAKVWESKTGQETLTLTGHEGQIRSAAYSPDGQWIATGSRDKTAKVWNSKTGQELMTLKGHESGVWSVYWSPDGTRILTASDDKTAKVWDNKTGQELMTLKGHDGGLLSAYWKPDGKQIVTASSDQTAKVWDSKTGQELMTLKGHNKAVYSAAWSPDGKWIVTGSGDANETAKVWDSGTGQEVVTLDGHEYGVISAAWSPDGKRIVTGSWDKTAKVWQAATGQELFTLIGHNGSVKSVVWSSDGQRILTAGNSDQTAKIWEAEMGQELFALTSHNDSVKSAVWSPDGKRILTAGSNGQTVKVWKAETGRELISLKGHNNSAYSAAWSPDGKRIVTSSKDTIAKVMDAQTGEKLFTLQGHDDSVQSAAWSPDGQRIVTGSSDQTAKVWDAQTGQESFTLGTSVSKTDYLTDWLFLGPFPSADLEFDFLTVIGGEQSIKPQLDKQVKASNNQKLIWKFFHSQEARVNLLKAVGSFSDVTAYAYCEIDNGGLKKYGYIGSDDGVAVWINGQLVHRNNVGREWAKDQDSFEVKTQSQQGLNRCLIKITQTIGGWDFSLRFSNGGHKNSLRSAVYSPDGKRILTADKAGIVQIYTTDIDELLQIAESRVSRQLTVEEKEKYRVLDW